MFDDRCPPDIDLGDGHVLWFTCWKPDRAINPQYAHLPDVEKFGALVGHAPGPNYKGNTGECMGGISFAGEIQAAIMPAHPAWSVEQWEPLTLSPSLLCSCGDHGFIRNGKWVRA